MDAATGLDIIQAKLAAEEVGRLSIRRARQTLPPAVFKIWDRAKRARFGKRAGSRGVEERRIIVSEVRDDGRRHELHATKGWRVRRA